MTSDHWPDADEQYRDWMRHNLRRAADHFRLQITGESVFGWLDRTVGARAGDHWLRVVSEPVESARGDALTGNYDANVISGVRKPRVLAVYEWAEAAWRCQRAEVLTLLPGAVCSHDNVPPSDLALSDDWWRELRRTVDVVRATPTTRVSCDQAKVDRRVRAVFDDRFVVRINAWETVHADLHWNNLLRDPFGLLDWEFWGIGPAGTDVATLYLYSLGVPAVAEAVRGCFADVLDSADGQLAQLYVAARLLQRSSVFGDHPELVTPLRLLVARLTGGKSPASRG